MTIKNKLSCVFLGTLLTSYTSVEMNTKKMSPDEQLIELTDNYFNAYLKQFPQFSTYRGISRDYDHVLPDRSLESRRSWLKSVEDYKRQLNTVKQAGLVKNLPLLSSLELEIDKALGEKICKQELWNVNMYDNAFRYTKRLIESQPFDDEVSQKKALQRYTELPEYFKDEINRLREGLRLNLTSPKSQVNFVIGSIKSYLKQVEENKEHSLYIPKESISEDFKEKWFKIVEEKVIPSFKLYLDFLENTYLDKARETVSISKMPGIVGEKCYAILAKSSTTSEITTKEIDELASSYSTEMFESAIKYAKKHFNVSTPNELYDSIKKRDFDRPYQSEDQIFVEAREILERAKTSAKNWFSHFPEVEIMVGALPKDAPGASVARYRPKSMTKHDRAEISFQIEDPKTFQRSSLARLTIHEGLPGHHMQVGIAEELGGDIHDFNRYFVTSAFSEGWAVYAEMLAYEQNFYTEEELGGYFSRRLSRNTLVNVDVGLHRKGWSREKAIKFLMNNGYKERPATQSVDAIISKPSLMLAYSIAPLEIIRIRDEYKASRGLAFDLKEFHKKTLENGNITIMALENLLKNE